MAAGAWDHSTVGPYRLVQRLGEGGMGVVHLGVGPDDRAVAVKVLKAHIAGDPDARRRLEREVATLRRVRHPRVAEVLDADVDGAVPYVVTRFVPGRTLDDLVRERGPMPIERVVHTGRLLAEALRAIHAAGVVHRDVKPANVMLVDDDPVLIDFGIAHVGDESRITVTGLVMGTPGYLSPEIVGGDGVTPATDWWGWGGTLAFAATGRPPFGTGPIEVVLDRVRRGAADLRGLDPRLQSVVATALAADPDRRPPGDWLIGALEDVLQARPGTGGAAVTPAADGAAAPTVAAAANGTSNGVAHGVPTAAAAGPAARTVAAQAAGHDARTVATPPPAARPAAHAGHDARTVATPPPAARPAAAAAAAAATVATPPPARPAAAAPTTPHRPMPTLAEPRAAAPVALPPSAPPPSARPVAPPAAALPAAPFAAGTPGVRPVAAHPSAQPPALRPPPQPPSHRPDVAPPPAQAPGAGAPGGAPPPEQPTTLLVAALVAFAALSAVAPGSAIVLLLLWATVARTADRSALAVWRRRYAHGPRPGDVPVTLLALPWRAVLSVVTSVFAMIVPLLVAASVAFVAGAAANGGAAELQTPTEPGALALAGAAAALTAWWGPGGGALRRGTTWPARLATARRPLRIGLLVFFGFVVVAALIVLGNGSPPDFAPFEGTA